MEALREGESAKAYQGKDPSLPKLHDFWDKRAAQLAPRGGTQIPSPRAAEGPRVPKPLPSAIRPPLPPGARLAHCLSHRHHASLPDKCKSSPSFLDAAGALLAFAQLPICLLQLPHPLPARPTPQHLSHPSQANSSENFPWEQFPLLIMPAAPAQLGAIWPPTAGKTSDTRLE